MADEIDEDAGWPQEEINAALTVAVEQELETANWDEQQVPQWINNIVENAMKNLLDLRLPYKFVVTCMLIQKTDRPLYSCYATYMENQMDNIEHVIYPPPRNKEHASKTIQCFATVMGCRF